MIAVVGAALLVQACVQAAGLERFHEPELRALLSDVRVEYLDPPGAPETFRSSGAFRGGDRAPQDGTFDIRGDLVCSRFGSAPDRCVHLYRSSSGELYLGRPETPAQPTSLAHIKIVPLNRDDDQ